MSPVPASAGQAGAVLERVRELGGAHAAALDAATAAGPGRRCPAVMAMTRPSIGVKPIVVSTDRPPATAASEAPAPRWHVTIAQVASRAQQLGGAPRGVGVREPVEAEPAARPLGRQRVGGGARRAASRGTRCRSTRRRACSEQPQGERVDRGERARLVQRRQLGELEQAARARRRRSRSPPAALSPPCTTRCATASGAGSPSSASVGERLAGRPLDRRARRPCGRRRRAAAASGCSSPR